MVIRCILLLGLLTPFGWAHRYHTSLTVIEHNPETQAGEITLRLLAQDLEYVLKQTLGNDHQLALTPEVEIATRAYISQHFKLKQGQSLLPLKWIGMEFDAESAYVYVEVPLVNGFQDLALYHQVFCELATVQINTVNFKDASGVRTQTHKRGSNFISLKPKP